MFLGLTPISWKWKKQPIVSKSYTKAEYSLMSSASSEIVWLHQLLQEFGAFQPYPIPLHADNPSAIWIVNNLVFHEHTKHVEVDCHFIHQHVVSDIIQLLHVSSEHQFADHFTKSLPKARHNYLTPKLMLAPKPHKFKGECRGTGSHTAKTHTRFTKC